MILLQHFTKQCLCCSTLKPFHCFYKVPKGKYGYSSRCKNCRKDYLIVNKETISNQKKLYNTKNKETQAKLQKIRRQTPQGRAIQNNSKYKRRSLLKQGDVTTTQLLSLYNQADVCFWCNSDVKVIGFQIDHYIPLAKGGLHTLSNLVISCPACNLSKGAKDPIAFLASIR